MKTSLKKYRVMACQLWICLIGTAQAQAESPAVTSVTVFATTATALSAPDKRTFSMEVYRTDELELAQKALLAPAGVGSTEKETQVLQAAYLREKGQQALHQLAPLVSRHYQGEQLARRYGISRLPAIVINDSRVIYDVTDVARAIAVFQKLQGR